MAETRTEALHQDAEGLDVQTPEAVLAFLANAQIEAAKAVHGAIPAIAEAAELIARQLKNGGRLAYAAAGSSGLMAVADALELPGTFGIARDRIAILIAGGDEAFRTLAGGPEDDTEVQWDFRTLATQVPARAIGGNLSRMSATTSIGPTILPIGTSLRMLRPSILRTRGRS